MSDPALDQRRAEYLIKKFNRSSKADWTNEIIPLSEHVVHHVREFLRWAAELELAALCASRADGEIPPLSKDQLLLFGEAQTLVSLLIPPPKLAEAVDRVYTAYVANGQADLTDLV